MGRAAAGINWAGYGAWALGFIVGILPNLPVSPELKTYVQPAVLYSFVVGFLVYIVLAKAGLEPENGCDAAEDGRVKMKAARIHQHGGPEVLVYEDVPDPQIKANQILVRVRACALNHLDLFVRAGIPGMKFPMPHILGSDIAGEVVAVGELCERVQAGWRVLLSPGLSCRQCAQCVSRTR